MMTCTMTQINSLTDLIHQEREIQEKIETINHNNTVIIVTTMTLTTIISRIIHTIMHRVFAVLIVQYMVLITSIHFM